MKFEFSIKYWLEKKKQMDEDLDTIIDFLNEKPAEKSAENEQNSSGQAKVISSSGKPPKPTAAPNVLAAAQGSS